jgi:type I restriction enzyme, S subunit
MSSVPNIDKSTWQVVCFGDMAQHIGERVQPDDATVDRYVGLEHLDPESLKIRRWGSPDDVGATKLRFYPGDIIFGKRRFYQRKLAVADFEGICSAHAMVLRAKPDVVLPEFLPFFMQGETFFERAMSISVGSLSPTINWSTLQRQEFALPPLDKQRRMAEVLTAVEETREKYMHALVQLETAQEVLTANLMQHGFSHEKFQDSKIGRIPKSWKLVELQDVANVIYGLTVNSHRRKMKDQYPYLRVANVYRASLDLTEIKSIGASQSDLQSYSLEHHDVLVVEGHADVNEIGRAALWESRVDLCLHQNHVLRVRSGKTVMPYFVMAYINSPRGRAYFQRMAKSTSGLNTINSSVLKKVPLPLPPLSEQEHIIASLRAMDEERRNLFSHIKRLENLKKASMNTL